MASTAQPKTKSLKRYLSGWSGTVVWSAIRRRLYGRRAWQAHYFSELASAGFRMISTWEGLSRVKTG
jgi:hypothetical protein